MQKILGPNRFIAEFYPDLWEKVWNMQLQKGNTWAGSLLSDEHCWGAWDLSVLSPTLLLPPPKE